MATTQRDKSEKSEKSGTGTTMGSIKVHRPRKRKTFDKDELRKMREQLELDGFIGFTIIPRFYNPKTGKHDGLKGHTITARAFSVEAFENALNDVEKVLQK